MTLRINGKDHTVEAEPSMPLLWVLRDILNMTGTKYGCGVAACGACTVHIDGVATRTCILPISAVVGKEIKTISFIQHFFRYLLETCIFKIPFHAVKMLQQCITRLRIAICQWIVQ